MFRPLGLFGRSAAAGQTTIEQCRTKVIYSESFLDKAQRLRLWNEETKLMFGPLIETTKAKERRTPPKESKKRVSKNMKHNHQHYGGVFLQNTRDALTTARKSYELHNRVKMITGKNETNKKLDEMLCIIKGTLPEKIREANSPAVQSFNSIVANSNLGKPPVEIGTHKMKNKLFPNSQFGVPSIIIRNLKMFPMMCSQQVGVSDSSTDSSDKVLRIPLNKDAIDFEKFPSVTKILTQTMSEQSQAALAKWKEEKIAELGVEGFERFNKAQLDNGKRFHELLSQHLSSLGGVPSVDQSLEGVWSSVGALLKNVSSPLAIESHVVHPVLKYRGIIDCIALYQDKPTLIEWKKSDKPKTTLSATFDNPVQLAAYFGAISHDTNYKELNVRDALLVIAYTDGSPADTFRLSSEQMRQHWAAWLSRLEKFWNVNEIKDEVPNKS